MKLDENFDEVDDVESVRFRRDLRRYRYHDIRHCFRNFLSIEFDNKEELKTKKKQNKSMNERDMRTHVRVKTKRYWNRLTMETIVASFWKWWKWTQIFSSFVCQTIVDVPMKMRSLWKYLKKNGREREREKLEREKSRGEEKRTSEKKNRRDHPLILIIRLLENC